MRHPPTLLTEAECVALEAARGPSGPGYEQFDRWLAWHQEQHPGDARGMIDLVGDYVAWCVAQEEGAK